MNHFDDTFAAFRCLNGRSSQAFHGRTIDSDVAIDGPSGSLTYSSLYKQIAMVSEVLKAQKVSLLGLSLPFSTAQIVAVCSAINCHIVFLPIDESNSLEHSEFMLQDAPVDALICMQSSPLLSILPQDVALHKIPHIHNIILAKWKPNAIPNLCEDAMYILYTSGSTGKPKGVIGSYSAMWNRLNWLWKAFPFETNARILRHTKLTFIDGITEVLSALCSFTTLIIAAETWTPLLVHDSIEFQRVISHYHVTRLTLIPSLLQLVLHLKLIPTLSSLQLIFVSGEPLHAHLVSRFQASAPSVRLINLYGSTEITGDISYFEATNYQGDEVPIGIATECVDGSELMLVDTTEDEFTKKNSSKGELWVAGTCLAMGYLNTKDEQSTRFQMIDGVRWFKTGDLCYWKDNMLYLSGRCNAFVKIAGIQIHLSSIEDCVLNYLSKLFPNHLFQAAVVPTALALDWLQYDSLVIFAAVENNAAIDTGGLLNAVFRVVPTVPSRVIQLKMSEFPRTATGKTDRKQLEALAAPSKQLSSFTSKFHQSIMSIVPIDWNDENTELPFHQLGINSMVLSMVAHTLQSDYKIALPLTELVSMSLSQLAALVNQMNKRPGTDSPKLRKKQKLSSTLQPLWQVHVKKCIDASPRLLQASTGVDYVVVGSHDHHLYCANAISGEITWCTKLPDRIESSCATYKDIVIVGCYDGGIYSLNGLSGKVQWVYRTQDQVKCSPIIIPEKNAVVCGSHDYHVYGLELNSGACIFTIEFSKGIFSSPVYAKSHDVLICASLSGQICCYQWSKLQDSSESPAWSFQCPAPVFSSLCLSIDEDQVFVGCADGSLYCFSIAGKLLWKIPTSKPIFSTPRLAYYQGEEVVVFGSHDGQVRCVATKTGSLLASVDVGAAVFSAPAIHPNKRFIIMSSIDGHIHHWDIKDSNTTIISHKVPGEVFSSPLIHNDYFYIGTRGDLLLCFESMKIK